MLALGIVQVPQATVHPWPAKHDYCTQATSPAPQLLSPPSPPSILITAVITATILEQPVKNLGCHGHCMETAWLWRQERDDEDDQWSHFVCWPQRKKGYTMSSAWPAFCFHPQGQIPSLSHSSHSHHSFDVPQFPSFPNPQSPTEPKVTLSLPSLFLHPHFPAVSCFPSPLFSPSLSLFFTCFFPTVWHPALQILNYQFPIHTSLPPLLSSWTHSQAAFSLQLLSVMCHRGAVSWGSLFPRGLSWGWRLISGWAPWHSRAAGTMLDSKTLSELTQSVNLCSSVKLQCLGGGKKNDANSTLFWAR